MIRLTVDLDGNRYVWGNQIDWEEYVEYEGQWFHYNGADGWVLCDPPEIPENIDATLVDSIVTPEYEGADFHKPGMSSQFVNYNREKELL